VSEYDSLIEGYPGLDDPSNDPGPLTDEEFQALQESVGPPTVLGIPVIEEEEMSEDVIALTELRALRPDQVPLVGQHYVIYGGKPMPVVRGNYAVTEDEHVRTNLDPDDSLKDHDGQRKVRADRTIRLRYRGYLCGEMTSL